MLACGKSGLSGAMRRDDDSHAPHDTHMHHLHHTQDARADTRANAQVYAPAYNHADPREREREREEGIGGREKKDVVVSTSCTAAPRSALRVAERRYKVLKQPIVTRRRGREIVKGHRSGTLRVGEANIAPLTLTPTPPPST